ncbi:MAG: hypothetical protein MZV64_18875 [Ignavibacteriales bacterium]|nr:hypothetical protein [Ignavibacteriales bacterium]
MGRDRVGMSWCVLPGDRRIVSPFLPLPAAGWSVDAVCHFQAPGPSLLRA